LIAEVASGTQQRPDALMLGGRGLKGELDRLLTNPLADFLFDAPRRKGTLHARIHDGRTAFEFRDLGVLTT